MRRLLALALLSLSATAAHAEIHTIEGTDGASFIGMVQGMPDLDQSRTYDAVGGGHGGGSMYCGPTAGANVLNYLARNGYPEVDAPRIDLEPLPEDGVAEPLASIRARSNEIKVEIVDRLITDLADAMNTSVSNGTDWDGMRDGLREVLPDDFTVTHEGQRECSGTHDIINPRKIFDHLDEGHIVIVRFGYYRPNAAGTRYTRQGGHWVVPTTIFRYQDLRRMEWSDSARYDGGPTTPVESQSPYFDEVSELEKVRVTTSDCTRNRWRALDRFSNSGDPAFIEDMIVIAPPGT